MKYFKCKAIAFVLALVAISSCSLGDDSKQTCSSTSYAKITAVTAPETIQVNQPAQAEVTFTVANDCGSFYTFAESNGIPKEVAAVVNYNGCDCDDVESSVTKTYNFTPTAVGEYVLKFYVASNVYITKTFTVTE